MLNSIAFALLILVATAAYAFKDPCVQNPALPQCSSSPCVACHSGSHDKAHTDGKSKKNTTARLPHPCSINGSLPGCFVDESIAQKKENQP